MRSSIVFPAILCFILASCAQNDGDNTQTVYELNTSYAAPLSTATGGGNLSQANTRPFIAVSPLEDTGNGRSLTLPQYIDSLYRDVLRRPATAAERQAAVTAYASGATIQQVAARIFSANPGVQSYLQDLQARASSIPPSEGRGFDNTDFLLYYLIFNNYYQQQQQQQFSIFNILPYLVNSKEYYTYILASYLMR